MEIALSLSGGGYRAAVYHIGVLSYLDTIKLENGDSLLDSVNILSSVSGGSLTSLLYILNKIDGKSNSESLKEIYSKIIDTDIEKELFNGFKVGAKEGNTLIMQLSLVYDKLFFHNQTFGKIINAISNPQFNIHHFAVCATDFNNGMPFHFYATRSLKMQNGNVIDRFRIGNSESIIDPNIEDKLHISDTMAASSCFPGVFEPLTFPNDFILENKQIAQALTPSPFSLMDGGVVDNQGIEAIVKLDTYYWKQGNSNIDLIMVSDVAKAMPQKFSRSKIQKFKGDNLKDTILSLLPDLLNNTYDFLILSFVLIGFFSLLIILFSGGINVLFGWCIGFISCFLFLYLYLRYKVLPVQYKKKINFLKKEYASKLTFDFDESFIYSLKTNSVLDFFNNRLKSLVLMSSDVMMGQIRKYKLKQAFNGGNECRTILNAIYALTTKGTWTKTKQKLRRELRPNQAIKDISDEVANIESALCFSQQQKERDIPKKLFVCGQYTTCWNLLMSIERIKAINESERNQSQAILLGLESQIQKDWDNFLNNPYEKSSIII